MRELVFASNNLHKLLEVKGIISARLPEISILPFEAESPDETGVTFLDNARIKAANAFAITGKPSFADDSGICVEVMGGSPGIFSAGWSGTRSDLQNRELLLAQLREIPREHRKASFVCTVSLIGEDLDVSFTGVWPGEIAMESRGEGGFGYDPVFIPEGFEVTAAELEPEVKNSMSHRFLAMSQLASYLDG